MNKPKLSGNQYKIERDSIFLEQQKDIISFTKRGDLHKIQLYLQNKTFIDLNIRDENQDSLLLILMTSDEIKTEEKKIIILKALLDYGLDLYLVNKMEQNVLHILFKRKYFKIFQFISETFNETCEDLMISADIFKKLPIDYLFYIDLSQTLTSDVLSHQMALFKQKNTLDVEKVKDDVSAIIAAINGTQEFKTLLNYIELIPQNLSIDTFKTLNEDFQSGKSYSDLSQNIVKSITGKNLFHNLHLFQVNEFNPDNYFREFEEKITDYIDDNKVINSFTDNIDRLVERSPVLNIKKLYDFVIPVSFPGVGTVEYNDTKDFIRKVNNTITHYGSINPRDHIITEKYFIQNFRFISHSPLPRGEPDSFYEAITKLIGHDINGMTIDEINEDNDLNFKDKIILIIIKGIMDNMLMSDVVALALNLPAPIVFFDQLKEFYTKYSRKDFLWYCFTSIISSSNRQNFSKLHNNTDILDVRRVVSQTFFNSFSLQYIPLIETILSGDASNYQEFYRKYFSTVQSFDNIDEYINDLDDKIADNPNDYIENLTYNEKLIRVFYLQGKTDLNEQDQHRIFLSKFNFPFIDSCITVIDDNFTTIDTTYSKRFNQNLFDTFIVELLTPPSVDMDGDNIMIYTFLNSIFTYFTIRDITTDVVPTEVVDASPDILEALQNIKETTNEPLFAIRYVLSVYGMDEKYIELIAHLYTLIRNEVPVSLKQVCLGYTLSLAMNKEYLGMTKIFQNVKFEPVPDPTNSGQPPIQPTPAIELRYGIFNEDFFEDNLYQWYPSLFGRFDVQQVVLSHHIREFLRILRLEITHINKIISRGTIINLKDIQLDNVKYYIEKINSFIQGLQLDMKILNKTINTSSLSKLYTTTNTSDLDDFIKDLSIWMKKQNTFIKNLQGVNFDKIKAELNIILSLQNGLNIINDYPYYYINPIEEDNVKIRGSRQLITMTKEQTDAEEASSDILSLGETFLSIIKEGIIYKVADNGQDYETTSRILNDYLKYVVNYQLDVISLSLSPRTGGAIFDAHFTSKKVINFANILKIYEKCQREVEPFFYILSTDYLSYTEEWDYEKSYNYFDNSVLKNIINTEWFDIKNPYDGMDCIQRLINLKNFLYIDKLSEEEAYKKKLKEYAKHVKKDEYTSEDIKKKIVDNIFEETCSVIGGLVIEDLKNLYEKSIENLSSFYEIYNDEDIINNFYRIDNQNCILKKESVLYVEYVQSVEETLTHVFDKFYETCELFITEIGVPVLHSIPNDYQELISEALHIILKYPEESEMSMSSLLEKMLSSLEVLNDDVIANVKELLIYYEKLLIRVANDIRNIQSNYTRWVINTAIDNHIVQCLKK